MIRHHLDLGANLARIDDTDPARPRAIPMPCDTCGEVACYGLDGMWACTDCWQAIWRAA